MASCTEIQVDRNHFEDSSSFDRRWFGFKALDCVNGTIMPRKHLPSTAANYTLIHQIFLRHGMANKLDVDIEKIPYETDITIYNKTKVKFLNFCLIKKADSNMAVLTSHRWVSSTPFGIPFRLPVQF